MIRFEDLTVGQQMFVNVGAGYMGADKNGRLPVTVKTLIGDCDPNPGRTLVEVTSPWLEGGWGIFDVEDLYPAPSRYRTEEQPPIKPAADSGNCGVMGIGGIGIYAENEVPFVPSERAMARYEKQAARARTCRRCRQTDVFDGAMFTTGGGDVCDDCF